MLNFPIFPVQASTFASKVDIFYYLLCIFCFGVTIAISGALLIFAAKFHKREGEVRPSKALHAPILEMTWTVVPLVGALIIFAWGALLYNDYRRAPEQALEIDIVGKQWMWHAQHAGGQREVNDLHVPVNRPVRLTINSIDVLHSYYLPAMRVKQDAIPGRPTYLWFEATRVGEYPIFCAEYCGTEHSLMGGTVYVMEEEDYAEWLAGGPKVSPQEAGRFLFEDKLGCVTCHSGQSGARGPDIVGLFGSEVTLSTGETVVADDDYLFDSILNPSNRIVQGYTPLMPNFKNQLDTEDVLNLIAYIKSLGGAAAP